MTKCIVGLIFSLPVCAAAAPLTERTIDRCGSFESYQQALRHYGNGATAVANGDARVAVQSFDSGVDALGATYYDEDLIDDSGMKLVLAKTEEAQGRFESAANLKKSVLESRLSAWRSKCDATFTPHTEKRGVNSRNVTN